MALDAQQLKQIKKYDGEQRLKYLLKEVVKNGEIWILTDEHGCVMLNTQDEDCVPVWPGEEFATDWATGEWENCKAEAISLKRWHSHWTPGLEDDELSLVVFPIDEEGSVLYPDELDYELKQMNKKLTQRKY